jgi:formylmethanofuran dehydrogenase subunit A
LNINDYREIKRAFSHADHTIKDGRIIARRGEILSVPDGRRFYSSPFVDEEIEKDMMADVKEWFKYYTLGFANYPVPDKYLKNPVPISVNKPVEAMMRR